MHIGKKTEKEKLVFEQRELNKIGYLCIICIRS